MTAPKRTWPLLSGRSRLVLLAPLFVIAILAWWIASKTLQNYQMAVNPDIQVAEVSMGQEYSRNSHCSAPRTGVLIHVWMVFSTKDKYVCLCVDGVQYQGQVCLPVCGWCSVPGTGMFACVWMVFSARDRYVCLCVDGVQYQGQVNDDTQPGPQVGITLQTVADTVLWTSSKKGEIPLYRIPVLTYTPEGNLVAMVEGRRKPEGDTHPKIFSVKRSTDG
ncbi:exo-alpha-(2-_3)-sialidase, partial [Branchiostoma belcheri]